MQSRKNDNTKKKTKHILEERDCNAIKMRTGMPSGLYVQLFYRIKIAIKTNNYGSL